MKVYHQAACSAKSSRTAVFREGQLLPKQLCRNLDLFKVLFEYFFFILYFSIFFSTQSLMYSGRIQTYYVANSGLERLLLEASASQVLGLHSSIIIPKLFLFPLVLCLHRALLCSQDWAGTHENPPALASQMLGSQL